MVRTGSNRALLTLGCLAVFLCVPGGGATATTGWTMDTRSPDEIRVCILPFYTSTAQASWDSDLGPLLESALSGRPWLEVVPTRIGRPSALRGQMF